jgi:hypothetical protein
MSRLLLAPLEQLERELGRRDDDVVTADDANEAVDPLALTLRRQSLPRQQQEEDAAED